MGTDYSDCYMCIGHTRDSGIIDESNWEYACDVIFEKGEDGSLLETEDVFIGKFGHWACGWVEGILIRQTADPEIIEKGHEIVDDLSRYPILDEDRYAEKELEHARDTWDWFDLRDRIEVCSESGVSIFAARRDELPIDCVERLTVDAH